MYKKINYIAAVLVLFTGVTAQAQVTSQSPYSSFGLGNVKSLVLPQLRAMGGISTGVYKPDIYNSINMQNPSTYSGLTRATIDIGIAGGFTNLQQNGVSENSFNSTLSHIALGFPIKAGRSGISFGLMPYTQIGYNYSNSSKVDTTTTNSIYTGEGGLSKAYFGFGQQFGEHFRIGGNVEYIFGNLVRNGSFEIDRFPSINSRQQDKNSVGGVSFSYGAQFEIPLSTKSRITLGYSGSANSTINSTRTYVATQYYRTNTGDESAVADTSMLIKGKETNLKLPLTHNFGFSIQRDNKWLFGVDYRMGGWSKLTIDGTNQGLRDSWGISAGGQFTPDITSINSYFKRVDYRLGFLYDQTSIQKAGQDIKQQAITFGFGLPLASSRYSLYKLNLTTEIGRRGTLASGLVKENYINFHLGFTLNDTWFIKNKLY